MAGQRRKPKPIKFRQSLFWDVNPKTIDPKQHARYIIERILDFGDAGEVRWLFHYYTRRLIRKVLNLPRSAIHEKSRVLWSLVLK